MPRFILPIIAFFVTCTTASLSQEKTKFESAEFAFSEDPTAVVLFVNIWSPASFESYSSTLYGDGRLELQVKHVGTDTTLESYETNISHQDVQALLRNAVHHGLCEWDGSSVQARILRANNGQPYMAGADGVRVTVMLSLSRYSRGEYSKKDLERIIKLADPSHIAPVFPDIIELQGVSTLGDWAMKAIGKSRKGDIK